MQRSLSALVFAGIVLIIAAGLFLAFSDREVNETPVVSGNEILLPEPVKESDFSVEEALEKRRSIREFSERELTLEEVSQILWSAQGITDIERGFRTAPSAGATFPLEVFLVAGNVAGLNPGIYRYVPERHLLEKVVEKNRLRELADACVGQFFVGEAQAALVFTGVFERTTAVYGERGKQYVFLEAGHAAQNVYLQAESIGLGTVVIGAFDETALKELLKLDEGETPLYVLPFSEPA